MCACMCSVRARARACVAADGAVAKQSRAFCTDRNALRAARTIKASRGSGHPAPLRAHGPRAVHRSAIGRWMTCAASSARCRSHGRRHCSTMTPSTGRRCSDGAFLRVSPHSFLLRMRAGTLARARVCACGRACFDSTACGERIRMAAVRRSCQSALPGLPGFAHRSPPRATELTAMHACCALNTWRGMA